MSRNRCAREIANRQNGDSQHDKNQTKRERRAQFSNATKQKARHCSAATQPSHASNQHDSYSAAACSRPAPVRVLPGRPCTRVHGTLSGRRPVLREGGVPVEWRRGGGQRRKWRVKRSAACVRAPCWAGLGWDGRRAAAGGVLLAPWPPRRSPENGVSPCRGGGGLGLWLRGLGFTVSKIARWEHRGHSRHAREQRCPTPGTRTGGHRDTGRAANLAPAIVQRPLGSTRLCRPVCAQSLLSLCPLHLVYSCSRCCSHCCHYSSLPPAPQIMSAVSTALASHLLANCNGTDSAADNKYYCRYPGCSQPSFTASSSRCRHEQHVHKPPPPPEPAVVTQECPLCAEAVDDKDYRNHVLLCARGGV